MPRQPYLYQHYNWPELGEAAKKQPVVVRAIDSMEDHGCTCRGVDYLGIPVSRLHEGPNTIACVERRIDDIGNHVMYDYLNLELP